MALKKSSGKDLYTENHLYFGCLFIRISCFGGKAVKYLTQLAKEKLPLSFRATTSSLIFIRSPVGQNHRRAGRRPPSTVSTEGTANLRSQRSSPRAERADTPCSAHPTPARSQGGVNCYPAIWKGSLLRHRVLSRATQVARLHGPRESYTTSTPYTPWLQAANQRRRLRWRLGPKLNGRI